MSAAVIRVPRDMEIEDLEIPRPKPFEVVVAVKAAGVCAADMCTYGGKLHLRPVSADRC